MANVGSLTVEVEANVARLSRDMKKARKSVSGLNKNVKDVKNSMDRFEGTIRKITGAIGGIFALRKAWDLAFDAARFQQAEQAFANLAESHGVNSQKILDNLVRVSKGTISTANLMQSAGTAMLLGIPADKLEDMMKIARATARITGQSMQEAFQDIAKGIGRQSKLVLDNLGIIVKAEDANRRYAEAMEITGRALTDTEKKQAFINETMRSGADLAERINAQALTSAEAMDKFKATIENLSISLGKILIKVVSFGTGLTQMAAATVAMIIETVASGVSKLFDLLSRIGGKLGDKFKDASKSLKEFAKFEAEVRDEAFKNADAAFKVSKAITKSTEAVGNGIKKAFEDADATDKSTKKKIDFEKKILDVVLATEKLNATTERKIELETLSLAMGGATLDQINRFVLARQQQVEVEKNLADAKERTRAAESLGRLGEAPGGLSGLATIEQLDSERTRIQTFWDEYLEGVKTLTNDETVIRQIASDRQIALDENAKNRRLAIAGAITGSLASIGNDLLAMMGSQSKKAQNVVKAAAIADAVVKGYSAAVAAWEAGMKVGGPPLAAVFTAASIAKTGALISKMGGSGGGAGGGGAPIAAQNITPPIIAGQTNRPTQDITVNISALDPSQIKWDKVIEDNVGPALERLSGRDGRNVVLDIQVAS